MANLQVIMVLCTIFISGLRSEVVNSHEAGTVLIDFEKYQKLQSAGKSNVTKSTKVCSDPENEEYRKCDNKCVLSCRHVPSIAEIFITKDLCDDKKCIEGCFCKSGLVRNQDKCVPAKDCPSRKGRTFGAMNENQTPFWKHFPFFHRPNCGPKGCAVIEIHNHNEGGYHGKHDDDDDDYNQEPVIVHVHGNHGDSDGSGETNNNNINNNSPINNIILGSFGGGCGSNCGGDYNHGGFPGGLSGGTYNPVTEGYTINYGDGFSVTYYRNGSYTVTANGRTFFYDSNGNLIGGGSGNGGGSFPQTSFNPATGGTTVTYSAGNSITYFSNGSRSVTANGITYNYDSNGQLISVSNGSGTSGSDYPITTQSPFGNYTSIAYSSSYAVTFYSDGSRSVYLDGVTYNYDSNGNLVSTTPGTGGLIIGGINAPSGGTGGGGFFSSIGSGFGGSGFGGTGLGFPPPGFGGIRKRPNLAIPNPKVPQIQPTRFDFPNPPKQVIIQMPDKRKVVKNQSKKDKQNYVPNFSNQFVPYQYQNHYPNIGNSKMQPLNALVNAAVAPGIVPLNYYPMPSNQINGFDSVRTLSDNKPSKKKSVQGSQSSKKSSKTPEKSSIPFISISVSPHQNSPNSNFQRDSVSTNIESPLKPMYSPNQKVPANQAAYFNYLNTYTPNFNNENAFPNQNVQPFKQSKPFNPFTTPFSSSFPNEISQQTNSELNLPNKVQNSFSNPNSNSFANPNTNSFGNPSANSPFSGMSANFPPQFFGNSQNSASNSRPFEYYDESEEAEEEIPFTRMPRHP